MEPFGYWSRPRRIAEVDLQQIHGHIFSVDTTEAGERQKKGAVLVPSEFREGPPANIEHIEGNFYTEFTDYLWSKGLENTFGLEAIQGQSGKMIEFSFDIGNLLLSEDEVTEEVREERSKHFTLQETGWAVTVNDGVVDQTGETRCVTYTTGHVKITNSQAKGLRDVIKILRDEQVLAT